MGQTDVTWMLTKRQLRKIARVLARHTPAGRSCRAYDGPEPHGAATGVGWAGRSEPRVLFLKQGGLLDGKGLRLLSGQREDMA